MIYLNVNHTKINEPKLDTPLVKGNVNSIKVKFVFSASWANLTKVAVFSNGTTSVSVTISDDGCAVPWEVLSAVGTVYVAVRGVGSSGNLILCTENEYLGTVEDSCASGSVASAQSATPGVIDTLLADVAAKADSNQGTANAGKFWKVAADGSLTFAAGGSGGGSDEIWLPTVDAEGNISWAKSDTETAPVSRNIKGPTGPQGATGAAGPQGETGAAGYTPVRGTDYWTAADIAAIQGYVDSAILNGSW